MRAGLRGNREVPYRIGALDRFDGSVRLIQPPKERLAASNTPIVPVLVRGEINRCERSVRVVGVSGFEDVQERSSSYRPR